MKFSDFSQTQSFKTFMGLRLTPGGKNWQLAYPNTSDIANKQKSFWYQICGAGNPPLLLTKSVSPY
jgi:hypothetical protein